MPEPPTCDCPPEGLDEGEPCGSDINGGCNSIPPIFTNAACGDTWCGTAWAEGGTRDTDWYLVNHGGGVISGFLVSNFPGVCFIVDGIDACAPVVVGDIGGSNDCVNTGVGQHMRVLAQHEGIVGQVVAKQRFAPIVGFTERTP